ncbi:MAG: carbohydrate ABC transporter permease, partial [Defluviitaleaceae bacterium]|nr:carbohydrate ABC transporter permease [Defluviitaleaceae bacterium]
MQSFSRSKSKMKEPFGDRVFNWINFFFAFAFFILVLYPLVYVVSSSFSDPLAIIQGRVRLFPVNPTLEGYITVFRHSSVVTGYLNSLWNMVVGTSFNVFLTVLIAYPLSRKDFLDRG